MRQEPFHGREILGVKLMDNFLVFPVSGSRPQQQGRGAVGKPASVSPHPRALPPHPQALPFPRWPFGCPRLVLHLSPAQSISSLPVARNRCQAAGV